MEELEEEAVKGNIWRPIKWGVDCGDLIVPE